MLYHIARIGIEQQMNRQFGQEPEGEQPKHSRPERTGLAVTTRLRLSASLRAIATAIEPSQPDPACAPSPQR